MAASVVVERLLRDGADVDVDDEWADQTVVAEQRTRWMLWVGRCNLAVLVVYTVGLTLFAVALGGVLAVLALLPIGLCVVFAKLLRRVGEGSTTARWGVALVVLVQLVAAGQAELDVGLVDPLVTPWLVLQVLTLGLLVL